MAAIRLAWLLHPGRRLQDRGAEDAGADEGGGGRLPRPALGAVGDRAAGDGAGLRGGRLPRLRGPDAGGGGAARDGALRRGVFPRGGGAGGAGGGDACPLRRRARPGQSASSAAAGIAPGCGGGLARMSMRRGGGAAHRLSRCAEIPQPGHLHKSEIGGRAVSTWRTRRRCGRASNTLLPAASEHAPVARIEGVQVASSKGAVEMALGVFRDPCLGGGDGGLGGVVHRGAEGRRLPPLPLRRHRGRSG
jgi:hypothetical protein